MKLLLKQVKYLKIIGSLPSFWNHLIRTNIDKAWDGLVRLVQDTVIYATVNLKGIHSRS